ARPRKKLPRSPSTAPAISTLPLPERSAPEARRRGLASRSRLQRSLLPHPAAHSTHRCLPPRPRLHFLLLDLALPAAPRFIGSRPMEPRHACGVPTKISSTP